MTALRAFLGLKGYYHRFVNRYARIASPLTDILKLPKFLWPPTAQIAFDNLKTAMVSLTTLALPDFSQPFDLTTDASGTAIGAVLSQRDRPISFFSKKLCPRLQFHSPLITVKMEAIFIGSPLSYLY
ncbi:putative mitochondrial protein AtMg00860 [Bidens hawaiensis]|uniref:putative mitochondrial protein AtMg00860 n=1 Tax=Bidens hawaiensis TaxID=980011 RepID=UPI00404B9B69